MRSKKIIKSINDEKLKFLRAEEKEAKVEFCSETISLEDIVAAINNIGPKFTGMQDAYRKHQIPCPFETCKF